MAAIPLLIYDGGFCHVLEGTLLNPVTEFFSAAQKSFYSLAKPGWQQCPLGYWVYAARDALGRRIVVPAVYLVGETPPRRKFPNHPIKFTRKQIEAFAQTHLSVVDSIRDQRDTEFKNLTHDLRAISTEIYHNALAARDNPQSVVNNDLRYQLELIINAQQMMSIRLDIIDYESGLSSGRPKEYIDPFPKIDKVVKCFSGKMRSKRVSSRFEGRSRDKIFGPPIFEIVPFVIIENALKYAPNGSEIIIRFQEEDNNSIIRFESYVPKIQAKEKTRIFEKSYRGEAVKDSKKSGLGIGLFAAQTIIENHFSGKIFVNQLSDHIIVNSEQYWITRFTIILPSFEDNSPSKPRRFENTRIYR
jgi:signal transduction histidine kinase